METWADRDAMLLHDDRFGKNFADVLSKIKVNARLLIYDSILAVYESFAKEHGFEVKYLVPSTDLNGKVQNYENQDQRRQT